MDAKDESAVERSKKILTELFNSNNSDFDNTSQLLSDFRILTREKTLNAEVLDESCINRLVEYSTRGHTEAQKCLSNLILNYPSLREHLIEPYVKCVESRLASVTELNDLISSSDENSRCTILYYDLRIIFLLSALCPPHRTKIRDRLLKNILNTLDVESSRLISQVSYMLVVEGLKTTFNLTIEGCNDMQLAGNVIKRLFSIVGTEKDITTDRSLEQNVELTDQLLVNLIHLLTNMPEEVYQKLSNEDVDKILNHLDSQLKTFSRHSFRDAVLPVLNVCANICKYTEEVRERWFNEILGSTTDFEKRPEEYDNLRGRLVKLMTSVDVHIKDIAAEFIHALCGGDTEKFITYTGFGNSAAFLSSRGLLSGARSSLSDAKQTGSTDDYQLIRDRIDPITGKLEAPKRNPMDGMSEEEKEYHACELAEAITRLSNLGVVRPMRIGEDGEVSELHPDSLKEKDL